MCFSSMRSLETMHSGLYGQQDLSRVWFRLFLLHPCLRFPYDEVIEERVLRYNQQFTISS